MDVPAWFIEILRQAPIVAIVLYVVFRTDKRGDEKEQRLEARSDAVTKAAADREDRLRKEARDDHDAEMKRLTDASEKALAAMEAKYTDLTEEVSKLRKEVASLTKRLQG